MYTHLSESMVDVRCKDRFEKKTIVNNVDVDNVTNLHFDAFYGDRYRAIVLTIYCDLKKKSN